MEPEKALWQPEKWREKEAAVLFSGGKDSLYALAQARDAGIQVSELVYAITTAPLPHNAHLANLPLLAEALGLPLTVIALERGREQASLTEGLRRLDVPVLISGNLFLQDIHDWYESACAAANVALQEPLWGRETQSLLREEVTWGLRALIIGLDEQQMPVHWLGKELGESTLETFLLESQHHGFDPCGEKGEFHTLVLHSPLHRFRLSLQATQVEVHDLSPYAGKTHFLVGELKPGSS